MMDRVMRTNFSMVLDMFEFLQFTRIKVVLLFHLLYDVKIFLEKRTVKVEVPRFKIDKDQVDCCFNFLLRCCNSIKYR